jgi:hypothetical protein
VLKLEYVVSAIGMAGPVNSNLLRSKHFHTEVVPAMRGAVDIVKRQVKASAKNVDPSLAVLFNAYTEKKFVEHMQDYNKFNMESVYADSGGLQMVTTGKAVTPQIKDDIYEIQTFADYAMCFDDIPLESVSLVRTRNERSNVGNKVFNQGRLTETAKATGENIKRQIEYFQMKGASTKVIIIVQGNTADDMVHWYETIQEMLTDDHFANVGGIAVADTCMGNKELETIDMLTAAHRIAKVCHPSARKQIHLLGVGSIPRMAPVLYLEKSGFLADYEKVSYDSSSHTVCFNYGLMKLNGTCKPLGEKRNHRLEETLYKIYEQFAPLHHKDYNWFADNVFFDKDGSWTYSGIAKRAAEKDTPDIMRGAALANFTYSMFQVKNFMECLDVVAGGEFIGARGEMNIAAVQQLLQVKDLDDMRVWNNMFGKYVSSARIARKEDSFGLEKFFG